MAKNICEMVLFKSTICLTNLKENDDTEFKAISICLKKFHRNFFKWVSILRSIELSIFFLYTYILKEKVDNLPGVVIIAGLQLVMALEESGRA